MTIVREDRARSSARPAVTDSAFDDDVLLPLAERAPHGALRLPDGRAMVWTEHGSARGLPCVLLPDSSSSRLAPGWLLHDSALPSSIRLLALDRPGIGLSDPIGFGGTEQPAEDLRRMVETLAVGRVAVIGIGQGADDAFAFAARYPTLVTSVTAVSVQLPAAGSGRLGLRRSLAARRAARGPAGPMAAWLAAAGRDADLTNENTWARIIRRLDPSSAAAVGDLWREADFRDAVAADAAQINPSWTAPVRSAAPAPWVCEPESVRVPVKLWHGEQETGTTLEAVSSFAAGLPWWTVHSTMGGTAVLGAWERILSQAAQSFPRRLAA